MRKTVVTISILLTIGIVGNGQVLEFEFGSTETDYSKENIYQTKSDGLLYIQHNSHINQLYLEVYAGADPQSLEKVAEIRWFGTITLPLQEGQYWKVKYNKPKCEEYVKDLTIRWTPIIDIKR